MHRTEVFAIRLSSVLADRLRQASFKASARRQTFCSAAQLAREAILAMVEKIEAENAALSPTTEVVHPALAESEGSAPW